MVDTEAAQGLEGKANITKAAFRRGIDQNECDEIGENNLYLCQRRLDVVILQAWSDGKQICRAIPLSTPTPQALQQ
ncbi:MULTISPECIES: hypothetical protein [Sinorhizobium]|uniref:hypothetical protein n=1 Tax=Sinorhizobium TaxID=28105 RepID=UPI001304BD3A|nr:MULTISPECIES: hypothetical protein [Sinorhizobium]